MAGNTSTVREVTFKKWAFASDFYFKAEGGIIISARCKFCSEVDYNKLFCEAKRRGLKGQVMKSLLSYRDNITYIHHKTLSRHVGDANSIHSWCKNVPRCYPECVLKNDPLLGFFKDDFPKTIFMTIVATIIRTEFTMISNK